MNEQHSLTARVITVGDKHAVIEVSGQQLRWPIRSLPPNLSEGETVQLRVLDGDAQAIEQQEQARAILAEILGNGR